MDEFGKAAVGEGQKQNLTELKGKLKCKAN